MSEDIWTAFERILKEHGHVKQESPEEAAIRSVRCINHDLPLFEMVFLAGVEWAKNNPAALVNWQRE